MSGHSKWKSIKHQKGAADAKRGQVFTKIAQEIALSVQMGGGADPDLNYRLRLAIEKGKASNMPSDTIERAVKRGGAETTGKDKLEEIIYEGYGPGGAAIMVQAVTTNRNRTASEVRAVFTKIGASLGESGCVAWNFEAKGIITLDPELKTIEEAALLAIDTGADDVKIDSSYVEIHTPLDGLERVKKELESRTIPILTAEFSMIPKSTVSLGKHHAEQTLRLMDGLEELQDSQKVYTNADFPEEVLDQYRSEE